jgi:uncharacterized RDD family membrane protein YckC
VWAIAAGGREAGTTTAATRPASDDPPHSSLAIYRLERGRWSRKAWLPPAITPADSARLAATVLPSGPIVSVLRTGGLIETVRLNERDWERLPALEAGSVQRIKLMTDGQRAILWAAGDGGAGTIYQLAHEWSKPTELRMPDPPRPGEPRTIALAGNNLRLLVQRDRKILEQSFSLDGTALTSAPIALPAAPAMPDSTPNRILTLVAAAMLMLVVLGSLRRGGGAAPASVATEAGITPAPLLPRLVAGIIDAMPLIIPSWFIFKDVDPSTEEMLSASTSWSVYAALGAYLAYNWLFEALFGRGVGKMLLGLRVVMLDGSPPPQRAIFARNVLRLVDVTMAAVPLILVLLSPLHQRAGDIAAKTVVIRPGAQRQDSADQPGE